VGRKVAWEGGCWRWGKGTPRRKLNLLARSHIEKKRKKRKTRALFTARWASGGQDWTEDA
jgi:hypothetical protein